MVLLQGSRRGGVTYSTSVDQCDQRSKTPREVANALTQDWAGKLPPNKREKQFASSLALGVKDPKFIIITVTVTKYFVLKLYYLCVHMRTRNIYTHYIYASYVIYKISREVFQCAALLLANWNPDSP